MPTKLMVTFLAVDFLFLCTGGLLLGTALASEKAMRGTPKFDNVAQNLLLDQCPLTAAVVNAIFVFVTFLISLPALALPLNRGWLKCHGWLTVVCALFTLILGLTIWFETLKTRSNLDSLWGKQTADVQSLLQQRFNCCGYLNATSPLFQQDTTCSNALVAAQKQGCVGPFSNFANGYLDIIFTAAFGIVALDVIMLLCTVMVLKYREELERYRHIDEKNGFGTL